MPTHATPVAPSSAQLAGERVDRVMGTTAHVLVRGAADPELQLRRLRSIEQRWSRFIDDSELSRVGRLNGEPGIVSRPTALLIDRSLEAHRRTAGLFDPTLLDHLEAAGYDRSFDSLDHVTDLDQLAPGPDGRTTRAAFRRSGPRDIEIHVDTGLVRLPAGMRIDPGGIGKGLAADLVAAEALGDGATGVLISVGGDLRAMGEAPADGWEIELDHHLVAPARINLRSGAVATSTRLGRRWRTPDGGVAHHVIDPRTGRPSTGPAVAVSVVASDAWWAEAVATAVLVGFDTPGFDELAATLLDDVGALVTTSDGRRHRLGPLGHAFALPPTPRSRDLASDREDPHP